METEEIIDDDITEPCSSGTVDSISEIQNEISKVKGDAIGNTLYSERWVLKLLIRLSEYTEDQWDSSFEQDLCLFWDMTTEPDVVLFLQSHEFFTLFLKLIKLCNNNTRLMEIMVGVVGNMCSMELVRETLSKQEDCCFVLINLLSVEDSLTLVQLIRLLNTCLWSSRVETDATRSNSPVNFDNKTQTGMDDLECDLGKQLVIQDKDKNLWVEHIQVCKDYVVQNLGFYMASSTNEELLCSTLELLETLVKIPRLALASTVSTSPDFISALVESLRQLLKTIRTGDSVMSNKRLWRACHVWKALVGTAATFQQGRINLALEGNKLMKCLTKLMMVLTTPEALKTQDPEIVMDFLYILETLGNVKVEPQVLARLISVLYRVTLEDPTVEKSRENDSDLEQFELADLILRTEQLIRHSTDNCDDAVPILQALHESELEFLYEIVSKDEHLSKKVYNAMLKLRTNGLVQ